MQSRKNISLLFTLIIYSNLTLFSAYSVLSSPSQEDLVSGTAPISAAATTERIVAPLSEENAISIAAGAFVVPSEATTTAFIEKEGLNLLAKGSTESSAALSRHLGLSIDGGGIRGVMPALWLKTLKTAYKEHEEESVDAPLCRIFDYVGGTSIGGIVSLGVAADLSPDTIVGLFENADTRKNIFSVEGRNLAHFLDFFGLVGHRYNANNLERLLQTTFGEDKRISDLKTNILITACTTDGHPWLFKKDSDPRKNYKLWEVARSTSAAPTYFDAYQLKFPIQATSPILVDGGIWANNPSTLVTAGIVKEFYNRKFNPDNIHLLSLGTGETNAQAIWQSAGKLTAGAIIEALMNSHSRGNHMLMEQLLGDNYQRINVDMTQQIDLADVSDEAYAKMKQYAQQEEPQKNIKNFVNQTVSSVRRNLEARD